MNTPTPPAEIPGLSLEERVSLTNLSEVWKGMRHSDGARVAVKFPVSAAAAEALAMEAGTAQALLEAGLVGIVPATFAAVPAPHLVMPWKGSRTLRDVLTAVTGGDERASAMKQLFSVIATVAQVHERGFMHGDLKPENVLVDDGGTPWLIDFGMARTIRDVRLDAQVGSSMVESEGAWGGTLHYLPPEGLRGDAPAPSWDVYACGVMLHEVLLGRRPDRAATPDQLRAVLPPTVVDLLLKALAWSAADRTPNVQTLLQELQPIREELTAAGSARARWRLKRFVLGGLAAFFVVYRYTSVLALLATYVALAWLTVTATPLFLIAVAVLVKLHFTIRWEGPESRAESQDRRAGFVRVYRRSYKPRKEVAAGTSSRKS